MRNFFSVYRGLSFFSWILKMHISMNTTQLLRWQQEYRSVCGTLGHADKAGVT